VQVVIASPYYTAGEAADYLRTTVQGIYSLVKRGKLKPLPGRPGRLLFTRGAGQLLELPLSAVSDGSLFVSRLPLRVMAHVRTIS